MSTEIGCYENDGDAVELSGGALISMQVLQQAYKDLTGKSESLNKNYKDNFKIEFGDLENLNSIFDNILEQYNVKERSCVVSVYHIDDSKEVYSSFDRFRIYEKGSLSPIENVVIDYGFMVVLPLAQKPQVYKISVELTSRTGVLKKAKSEDSFFASRFFYFYAMNTASVSIDYVDYALARNLRLSIENWLGGLRKEPVSLGWSAMRKLSHHLPFIFKYLTAVVVSGVALWYLKHAAFSSLHDVSFLTVSSLALVYVAAGAAFKAGDVVASAVERYLPLSYIKLVRGDEDAISEFNKGNRWALFRMAAGVLLAVAINMFSNWLGKFWGI